ncbi:MAG: alpha/beta hydrolase [Betaproteobacteria bacterium]|nr:alpha/beta hydrolase [Betaproteobacteria bacterium]
MPLAKVRSVDINYEILGTQGPWVALSPGGRNGLKIVKTIAKRVADAGFRVVLHDRRNCGASDVVIDGKDSEYEIWADDLYELLSQLKALPAFVGGSSSGCRTSILFALRHPGAAQGLLLWRVTGGGLAARRLAKRYYGDMIAAAQQGGMAAVCETEHFKERIEERPANRERLMAMDPKRFIEVMTHWNEYFVRGADQPVIGVTEEELKLIKAPACVVPGNDLSHTPEVGETLSRLLPRGELHRLVTKIYDLEVAPLDEWNEKEGELIALFVDFMKRAKLRATA